MLRTRMLRSAGGARIVEGVSFERVSVFDENGRVLCVSNWTWMVPSRNQSNPFFLPFIHLFLATL